MALAEGAKEFIYMVNICLSIKFGGKNGVSLKLSLKA